MSFQLTNAAISQFDSEVKHQYQGKMTLRDFVTTRMGVVGATYQFARMGRGMAQSYSSPSTNVVPSDLPPMGINHARQTATLLDYHATEYTNIFDQAEVNYSEKMELAKTIAMAIGRREDQIILNAMRAVTFVTGDPTTAQGKALVSGNSGADDFGIEMLYQAREYFQDLEVDPADQYFAVSAHAMNQLLRENKVASFDYNTSRVLTMGDVKSFLGFNIYVIGSRGEGGLQDRASNQVAYAWHKPAVGYASSIDRKTTIDWVPEKISWICVGLLKAGAVARDPQGVVEIRYTAG